MVVFMCIIDSRRPGNSTALLVFVIITQLLGQPPALLRWLRRWSVIFKRVIYRALSRYSHDLYPHAENLPAPPPPPPGLFPPTTGELQILHNLPYLPRSLPRDDHGQMSVNRCRQPLADHNQVQPRKEFDKRGEKSVLCKGGWETGYSRLKSMQTPPFRFKKPFARENGWVCCWLFGGTFCAAKLLCVYGLPCWSCHCATGSESGFFGVPGNGGAR